MSWKYALGLDLDDEGFDASVLSEFRTRVVEHGLEQRVLDLLLDALAGQGLVGAGGKARTDSTHVISAVRDLNRLELAGESVRACLEAVAAAAPHQLPTVIDIAGWGRRYGARIDTWRLPAAKAKRAELVAAYGADALVLLRAIVDAGAPRPGCASWPPSRCCAGCWCRASDHHRRQGAGGDQGAGDRHRRSPGRQSAPELAV
jgi:hypothetical protein